MSFSSISLLEDNDDDQLHSTIFNQSINVFQGKIQTVQFTNVYKHILFLHDIHMILVIMKTN